MAGIRIDTNIAKAIKDINRFDRVHIPAATASTINDIAFVGRSFEKLQMKRDLDQVARYTLNSHEVRQRARAKRLVAIVGIKKRQAEYLRWSVSGGLYNPPGNRPLLIPEKKVRNEGSLKRRINRARDRHSFTKVGTYRKRKRGNARRVIKAIRKTARYKPKYRYGRGYQNWANIHAGARFRKNMNFRIQRAAGRRR